MKAMLKVPDEVPDNLKHLAEYLSWDDAAQLTCQFERWAIKGKNNPDTRARLLEFACNMRTLVQTLPYNWNPPLTNGKMKLMKRMAEFEREITANSMRHTDPS